MPPASISAGLIPYTTIATAEIRGAAGRLLAARGDVVGGRNECSEALAVFERLGPVYMVERTKRRITELDVTGQAQTA